MDKTSSSPCYKNYRSRSADVLTNALEFFGLTPKAAKKTVGNADPCWMKRGSRPEGNSKNSSKRFSSM